MFHGQTEDVGNYHFFSRDGILFVYDFVNNILYRPKNTDDYVSLHKFLTHYTHDKHSCLENYRGHKFYSFVEKFQDNTESFSSTVYLREVGLISSKITLMISQSCNLRCKYCYGHEGKFGLKSGGLMSKETAEQTMRFFVAKAQPIEMKNCQVTFFGGEPLMNFTLIKHLIEFNKKTFPDIAFTYTMTTNLTLMTQNIAEYFKKENIAILVSLDGFKQIHDKNRIFEDGNGSFNSVINGIKILKDNDISFSVRATLSHEFYDRYEDIVEFFKGLGAQQAYISRLCDYEEEKVNVFDTDVDALEVEISMVNGFHDRTHERILEGDNPYHVPFLTMYERIHEADKSLISCGIFKGSTTVSVNGDLYPCHRFVGIEGFCFGNVNGDPNLDLIDKIAKNLDSSTLKCKKCWARYLCKRGCLRDIAKKGGVFVEYPDKYCNLMRDSIEKALWMYYLIVIKRPDYVKEFSRKEIEVYNVI